MSTGFQPPSLPMPSYCVPEEWACRTCSRLIVTVVQEYPHPRLRLDCTRMPYVPLKWCPEWEREMGVD